MKSGIGKASTNVAFHFPFLVFYAFLNVIVDVCVPRASLYLLTMTTFILVPCLVR